MHNLTVVLSGREGRIASVMHNDSWYGHRGNRASYLEDKIIRSRYDTQPASGSATLTLIRSDGKTRILWDGKPVQSGTSGRPLDRLKLSFGFYPYDGAKKSILGTRLRSIAWC